MLTIFQQMLYGERKFKCRNNKLLARNWATSKQNRLSSHKARRGLHWKIKHYIGRKTKGKLWNSIVVSCLFPFSLFIYKCSFFINFTFDRENLAFFTDN